MKKFKNLVIGGIQTKVFNLILITVILLTAAFSIVSVYHGSMLSKLSAQSGAQQQAETDEIIEQVMQGVLDTSMTQSVQLEAYIADELFHGLDTRVQMLGEYAGKLFGESETYPRMAFAAPDPALNGQVTAQLILADGVNAGENTLNDRLGLIANMSDMMISLFGASDQTNSCFVALPDGAFLVVDDRSATKFAPDGSAVSYDPRTRPWYIQAVDRGKLIFTDVEIDAFTGDIGIVCAMPVYQNGELAAVVGSDLFLTSMQTAIQNSENYGSFLCVVNNYGHVVFSPKAEGSLRVEQGKNALDLRTSENGEFAALVRDAASGLTGLRLVSIDGTMYYAIGAPIGTLGWSLISVCDAASAAQPSVMLHESYQAIQNKVTEEYRHHTAHSKNTALVLLIASAVLMLSGALVLGKRIVKPLNTITRRIAELSEGNLEFKMEDAYRTGDEVEELAECFASLSHKTVQYVEKVRTVTAEKERIGTELALATDIQAAMLPHIFPAFPDRAEFDIFASMDPAKEVGGDFYDYFLVDDDHLCMVIADVSGKGVPAALFMMASKIILQSCAMLGSSAAQILTKTNEALCTNNEAQMFVTVWLGILELSTGRLTCANAGHEYPAVAHAGGSFELFRDRHGFVIGGLEEARYREYELQLEPGSRLFVYTDGVPEATNADKELFGTERMLAALNQNLAASPQTLLAGVRTAVDGFVKDAEQFDDLTMLCLEYRGPGKKNA